MPSRDANAGTTPSTIGSAAEQPVRPQLKQVYGNVKRSQQEDFGGRLFGVDLRNPDFVRLSESFGVRGARVRTPRRCGRSWNAPSPAMSRC